MSNTISLDEVRTIKINQERSRKANVEVGDKVRVGGQFAFQHDYEIYRDADGVVAMTWPDYARAAIALESGKLLIVQIEDCVKAVR